MRTHNILNYQQKVHNILKEELLTLKIKLLGILSIQQVQLTQIFVRILAITIIILSNLRIINFGIVFNLLPQK